MVGLVCLVLLRGGLLLGEFVEFGVLGGGV